MGATLGLIAGGILKGIGDAKQQEAADARTLALEDLRERRREAERREARVWDIEDRDYKEGREDVRDERNTAAKIADEARRDVREEGKQDRIDQRTDKQIAAADERDRNREDNRDRREAARGDKPKTPGQIAAPLLEKISRGEALTAGEQKAWDMYAKLSPREIDDRNYYGGDGGGGGQTPAPADPTDAPSSAGPGATTTPAPRPTPTAAPKTQANPAATAPNGAATSANPTSKVITKGDYDALPSGASFIAPDGSRRVKP